MKYERSDKYTKPHTPVDVLKLALAKEQSSYSFYCDMIKQADNPILLKLLEDLKNAELGHIRVIKNKLDK